MIESNEIFFDSDKRIALWCNDIEDTSDLAVLADSIIENKIPVVSVPSKSLSFLWTCLEKTGVKIFTRYFVEASTRNFDIDISELSQNIISFHKHGANGVQIFVKNRDLERFVELFSIVRDDLFFEHDLCIVMNIQDINVDEWAGVFDSLRELRTDSFGLVFDEDMGNRSDFIGRIYSMLDNWNFAGDLHFMLGNNFDRIDQVIRLVESMRPELSDKLHFFLEY